MGHVLKGLADLLRDRAEIAAAGGRINRSHAGEEDVIAGRDARRMRQVGVARNVELRVRRLDDATSKPVEGRLRAVRSSQGHAFDLDLVVANQLSAAYRPGGRIGRKKLSGDRIHVAVFEHRINQHIDFDDMGKRGAGRLQQLAHVGQDLPCLGGHGVIRPLTARRIDRRHARNKNEVATPHRCRQRQVGFLPDRGLDHLPKRRHIDILALFTPQRLRRA